MIKIDKLDYDILKLLKMDGRQSHEKIAQQVKLSRPAVRARIVAMEKSGIIDSYTTKVNYEALGFKIQVFIYIKVVNTSCLKTIEELYKIVPEHIMIEEHFRISGEWCLLLRVMCRSQSDITHFLDAILNLESVASTNTVLIFNG